MKKQNNYITPKLNKPAQSQPRHIKKPPHRSTTDDIADSAGEDEPYSPNPYVMGMATDW